MNNGGHFCFKLTFTLNSTCCDHHGTINIGATILVFLDRLWNELSSVLLYMGCQLSANMTSNSTQSIHWNGMELSCNSMEMHLIPQKQGIDKKTLPRNWLTFTAPPVACLATLRLLATVGLTWVGLSSGVMCSRSLDAPLWMAFPVYSAPFTNPQLSHEAPVNMVEKLGPMHITHSGSTRLPQQSLLYIQYTIYSYPYLSKFPVPPSRSIQEVPSPPQHQGVLLQPAPLAPSDPG